MSRVVPRPVILQEIGNAKRGAECTGGIRRSEVMREDALAHDANDATDQNARADHERRTARALAAILFLYFDARETSSALADNIDGFAGNFTGVATMVLPFVTLRDFGV